MPKKTKPKAAIALDFDGTIADELPFLVLLKNASGNELTPIVTNIKEAIRNVFQEYITTPQLVTGSLHSGKDVYTFWCTPEQKDALLRAPDESFFQVFLETLTPYFNADLTLKPREEMPYPSSNQIVFFEDVPVFRAYMEAFADANIDLWLVTNRLTQQVGCKKKTRYSLRLNPNRTNIIQLDR